MSIIPGMEFLKREDISVARKIYQPTIVTTIGLLFGFGALHVTMPQFMSAGGTVLSSIVDVAQWTADWMQRGAVNLNELKNVDPDTAKFITGGAAVLAVLALWKALGNPTQIRARLRAGAVAMGILPAVLIVNKPYLQPVVEFISQNSYLTSHAPEAAARIGRSLAGSWYGPTATAVKAVLFGAAANEILFSIPDGFRSGARSLSKQTKIILHTIPPLALGYAAYKGYSGDSETAQLFAAVGLGVFVGHYALRKVAGAVAHPIQTSKAMLETVRYPVKAFRRLLGFSKDQPAPKNV